jgi:ParB family chromosome partitioning protein
MNGVLKRIALSKLVPHPDNPRLSMRADVIDGIAEQLKKSGVFADMHALIVRGWTEPDGRACYQILSGHQRCRAAERAEIAEVPCWIVDLGDADALMLLVTCNSQGELCPLEYGLHVLKAVPRAQGKKGKGLEAYAAAIGKTKQYVSELRQAAEVAIVSNLSTQADKLRDKAKHLAAIHALPKALWPGMVDALVTQEWTLADTEAAVKRGKEYETRSPSHTSYMAGTPKPQSPRKWRATSGHTWRRRLTR